MEGKLRANASSSSIVMLSLVSDSAGAELGTAQPQLVLCFSRPGTYDSYVQSFTGRGNAECLLLSANSSSQKCIGAQTSLGRGYN